MAKKTKTGIRKSISKAMVAYIIDVTAGPQLMMIGMREPQRAEKMNNALVNMIQKGYKDVMDQAGVDGKEFDTKGFIATAIQQSYAAMAQMVALRLETVLKDGTDPKPLIIKPPGTIQNPPRMM